MTSHQGVAKYVGGLANSGDSRTHGCPVEPQQAVVDRVFEKHPRVLLVIHEHLPGVLGPLARQSIVAALHITGVQLVKGVTV